jgi:uncharacterized protein (TIGR04141 family)
MWLNIFKVEPDRVPRLKAKLDEVGLVEMREGQDGGWTTSFRLTQEARPHQVPWLRPFEDLLDERPYYSLNHAGVYLLERDDACFAISFGTAFHYLHPFADPEFGLNMARRIGDEHQVKQRALRRFGSKKRKEITDFAPDSGLFLQSGESVDLIKASIIQQHQHPYGKTGKFGTSFGMTLKGGRTAIPGLCDAILATLDQPEAFRLPLIVPLDRLESARYDQLLLEAIQDPEKSPQFTTEGHEVIGVDFVFSGADQHRLTCRGYKSESVDVLDIDNLRKYIIGKNITDADIFNIRVETITEDGRKRSRGLRQSLDYTVPNENVTLDGGTWKRFNEQYIDQLNEAVDDIDRLVTEPSFEQICIGETQFNASRAVKAAGYENADKDFSLMGLVGSSTPIEAYDLRKDNIVYALKFGPAQKLSYVCEQAMNVAEILRNNADTEGLERPHTYCLWLGLDRSVPGHLSELQSVILKQRLAAWAQACREIDVRPAVKLSKRVTS